MESRQAAFGQRLTLRGAEDDLLSVTPEAVMDGMPLGEWDTSADAGYRHVGITVLLDNRGDRLSRGFLANDAHVVPADGRRLESSDSRPGESCDESEYVIPAGEARRVCVVFHIPYSVGVAALEVMLDSGTGPEMGQ